MKNPYTSLRVKKNATSEQIKKAYYLQSKAYHPDVNSDAGAEKRFKEIAEAYAILSDPEKRKEFDETGTIGKKQNETTELLQYFNSRILNYVIGNLSLEDLMNYDITDTVKDVIKIDIGDCKRELKEITNNKLKLDTFIKRINHTSESEFIINGFESILAQIEFAEKNKIKNIEFYELALKYATEWTYNYQQSII
jgi:hypothetical protein